ncbi:unnamed protein product, partial [Iphiclides podalirius]
MKHWQSGSRRGEFGARAVSDGRVRTRKLCPERSRSVTVRRTVSPPRAPPLNGTVGTGRSYSKPGSTYVGRPLSSLPAVGQADVDPISAQDSLAGGNDNCVRAFGVWAGR